MTDRWAFWETQLWAIWHLWGTIHEPWEDSSLIMKQASEVIFLEFVAIQALEC